MKRRTNQKGFTIIELVVVILLLGILTATALPRFMDVTDEAHQAVVDGLQGGLQTGVALYRAQWVAVGQPTNVGITEFGGLGSYLDPDSTPANQPTGYPAGEGGTTAVPAVAPFAAPADCVAVYNGVMQAGGLPAIVGTAAASADATDIPTDVGALLAIDPLPPTTANADIVAAFQTDDAVCVYVYVGQYTTGQTVQTLTYSPVTGVISQGTVILP